MANVPLSVLDITGGGQINVDALINSLNFNNYMPLCVIDSLDGGRIDSLVGPGFTIESGNGGQPDLNALVNTLSMSQFQAGYLDSNSVAQVLTVISGGIVDLIARSAILAVSGNSVGSLDLYDTPICTLSASGEDGPIGSLSKDVPRASIQFIHGGRISVEALAGTGVITGGDRSEGDMIANALLATLAMSGLEGTAGEIAIVFPLSTLAVAGYESTRGTLTANVPIVVLTAKDLAELYRCIVMNQKNFAITEYANFNFNSLVQVGDRIFLASETGLYLMGGENDAGTDIDARVRTVLDDFGSSNIKNVPDAYISCRASENIMVATVEDDGTLSSEQEVICGNPDLKNKKVNFARGKKQRYWGVEIRNTNGGTLDIDGIDLNAAVLRRKV